MDPFAGVLYGESDLGKTLLMVAALEGSDPAQTAYLAGRGGLSTGAKALKLPNLAPRTFCHNRPTLSWGAAALPKLKARGFTRVGLDDISIMAGNELDDLVLTHPKVADRYMELARRVRALGNAVRGNGFLGIAGAHVRVGNRDREGTWHPGGPDLKGNKVMTILPYAFDFCAQVRKVSSEAAPAAQLLHAEFYVPGPTDEDWVSKDRYDVFHKGRKAAPANLREYLRAAGQDLGRAPGLAWQDAVADKVAARLLAGQDPRAVWEWAANALRGRFDMRHVRWAVEDGFARSIYTDPILSDPMYLPPVVHVAATDGAVTDLEDDAPDGADAASPATNSTSDLE